EWNIPAQTSALLDASRTLPDRPDTVIVLDYPPPPTRPEPSLQDVASGAATMQIDPFMPLPIWTVLESGRVVSGHTYAYQLRVHGADGSLERVIVSPRRREPVTAAMPSLIEAKFTEQMLNTPGAG